MIPLALLLASAIVRLIDFGRPAAVVFDEVHNGFYLNAYWQGQYFFDVHPPLAKIITAIFGWLIGVNDPTVDWSSIGNALPDSLLYLRIIPLIAGIILPIVVYAILRRLEVSKLSATVASLFVVFENSLVVQSRFILYDEILLLLGFSAILFYLEWRRRSDGNIGRQLSLGVFLTLSILCAAGALSIKWTGLSFLGMIILMEIWRFYEHDNSQTLNKKLLDKFGTAFQKAIPITALFVGVSFIVYMLVFAVHFALLPNSGNGNAFMTPAFQKTLIDSPSYNDQSITAEGFLGKFTELNARMWKADQDLVKKHNYSSRWYSWPFMTRPIFYWQSKSAPCDSGNGTAPCVPDNNAGNSAERSYIYYLGNPLAYWAGFAAILWLFAYRSSSAGRKYWRDASAAARRRVLFVLVGFAANFLPFILIGRTMFLYHYEAALIFGIMALALFLENLPPQTKRVAAAAFVCLSFALFVYFSPLTYGTPISDAGLKQRMWMEGWR